MKKNKNILFIFIALFMFVGGVDAADYATEPTISTEDAYDLTWNKKYAIEDENATFLSVASYEDGSIAGGYRTYCETSEAKETLDVSAIVKCYEAALLVRYDKDGNVVWASDLYAAGSYSLIYDLIIGEEKIYAFVLKEVDSEEEAVSFVELVEFDLNGKMQKSVTLGESDYLDFVPHLSYYNDLIAVSYNDRILIYNSNLELVKELDSKLVYPAVKMDKTGIYVAGNDYDSIDIVLYKYDYNYEKVTSKTLVTVDEENEFVAIGDLEFLGSNLSISTLGYNTESLGEIFVLDKAFNVIKEVNAEESYIYSLKESRKGLIAIEARSGVCSPTSSYDELIDAKSGNLLFEKNIGVTDSELESCEDVYYLVKYDSNLNKLWEKELGYMSFQLDTVKNGVVVAGFASNNDTYYEEGVVEKYNYDDFIITSTSDGNGTVTSSKVVSASGEVVEFTVEPKEGYQLKKVVVTTEDGEVIEFTDYKFTMPSADVEIYAEFELVPVNPNTGLDNPFMICGIALVGAGIGYCFLKKKKYI